MEQKTNFRNTKTHLMKETSKMNSSVVDQFEFLGGIQMEMKKKELFFTRYVKKLLSYLRIIHFFSRLLLFA